MTDVDGQRLHALHVRSPHANARPLVLAHGWPGSIVEFLDCIAPLTDPPAGVDAFHVVVPSLPGFGFSGPTAERGWHARRAAQAVAVLMAELGYGRYGVQGGDYGAIVACNLADLFPDRVIGLHVNFLPVPRESGDADAPSERARSFAATGRGYSEIQGTKPQTIGYLLDDSPAGLAA